jgi:hypothetical protein
VFVASIMASTKTCPAGVHSRIQKTSLEEVDILRDCRVACEQDSSCVGWKHTHSFCEHFLLDAVAADDSVFESGTCTFGTDLICAPLDATNRVHRTTSSPVVSADESCQQACQSDSGCFSWSESHDGGCIFKGLVAGSLFENANSDVVVAASICE